MTKDELDKIRLTLEKIVENWFLCEPLIFAAYCTHMLVMNPKITVPFRSGKLRIEYNPELLSKMNLADIKKGFETEMIRILLKHPYTRKPDPFYPVQAILASNISILQNEVVNLNSASLPPNLSYEQYYSLLCGEQIIENPKLRNGLDMKGSQPTATVQADKNSESQGKPSDNSDDNSTESNSKNDGNSSSGADKGNKQEGNPTDSNNSSSNSQENQNGNQSSDSNNSGGNLSAEDIANAIYNTENGPTGLWDENEMAMEQLNQMIKNHAANGKTWGNLGGKFQQMIMASLTAKIDYRKVLKNFRATILSEKRHLTRFKPSRRFGFEYMGGKRDFSTKLLLAIDTSGSISDKDLQNFYGVINKFFKYGIESIDVINFDYDLKGEPVSFKKKQTEFKITGRGGTCFQPVFDYAKNHSEYDGVIIFTDGYAEKPQKKNGTKARFVWVCRSEDEWNEHHDWMNETGKSCFLTA